MTARPRRIMRTLAATTAIVIGWLCLMAVYVSLYGAFEREAVPVSVSPFKDFYAPQWEQGYVFMAGSLANDTANPDDQLLLQTSKITCRKDQKECSIATASIFNRQVMIDEDRYDITEWTDRFISFENDAPICYTEYYTINRVAQSLEMISKKKKDATEQVCKSGPDERRASLRKGSDVYWARVLQYEARNGIYFHLLLAAMNIAYGVLILALIKRRRSRLIAAQP